MDLIVEQLKTLSKNDLIQLKSAIDKHLLLFENNKLAHKIQKKVADKGHYCSTKIIDNLDGYERLKLKFYINIYTWDKEGKSGCQVSGDVSEDQDSWVDVLEFEGYQPTNSDRYEPPMNDKDWIWHDWDDPITCRVPITIYVYYMVKSCPREGSICKIVDEEGEVQQVEITNGKIMLAERYIDHVDNWDSYKFFVIKVIEPMPKEGIKNGANVGSV